PRRQGASGTAPYLGRQHLRSFSPVRAHARSQRLSFAALVVVVEVAALAAARRPNSGLGSWDGRTGPDPRHDSSLTTETCFQTLTSLKAPAWRKRSAAGFANAGGPK